MVLLHWMSDVCVDKDLRNHTFFQAEAFLKVFLAASDTEIKVSECQALGAAMLFVAAKLEEPIGMNRTRFLEFAKIPDTEEEYEEDHIILFEEFENTFCEKVLRIF
ncbi:hypothetical protein BC830DRAFT_1113024 [Chytriomyces sp. MP71]|nr:hypothetical protein BC830DRAFT_1113024 [Chytriomyces sp. MP71]